MGEHRPNRHLDRVLVHNPPDRVGSNTSYKTSFLCAALELDLHQPTLASQGHHDEAEALFRRYIALKEQAAGPEHYTVARYLENLADLLKRQVQALMCQGYVSWMFSESCWGTFPTVLCVTRF